MMDQDHRNGDESSGSADPGSKCCTICGTTKTPLWRGGPSGPKSLCNACGIRYRKERREPAALKAAARAAERMKKERKGRSGGKKEADLLALLGLDAEALLKGRSALWLKRRRRLAEEEEAAVLLMALSSGFL